MQHQSTWQECPFRCGYAVPADTRDEDGRRALCVHLRVEHGADESPDRQAWESYISLDPLTVEYIGTLDSPPFRFPSEDE